MQSVFYLYLHCLIRLYFVLLSFSRIKVYLEELHKLHQTHGSASPKPSIYPKSTKLGVLHLKKITHCCHWLHKNNVSFYFFFFCDEDKLSSDYRSAMAAPTPVAPARLGSELQRGCARQMWPQAPARGRTCSRCRPAVHLLCREL